MGKFSCEQKLEMAERLHGKDALLEAFLDIQTIDKTKNSRDFAYRNNLVELINGDKSFAIASYRIAYKMVIDTPDLSEKLKRDQTIVFDTAEIIYNTLCLSAEAQLKKNPQVVKKTIF